MSATTITNNNNNNSNMNASCKDEASSGLSMTLGSGNPERDKYFLDRKERVLDLMGPTKCRNCWFLKSNCICNTVQPVKLKHRYITLFHHKEWSRVSNTGKLLTLASNKHHNNSDNSDNSNNSNSNCSYHLLDINRDSPSKVLVMKIEEDEAMLKQILDTTDHKNIFVLFPSPDSITIEEYLSQFKVNNSSSSKSNSNSNSNDNQINVNSDNEDDTISIEEALQNVSLDDTIDDSTELTMIILDGTWSQAKKQIKNIPEDIKRVRLTFGEKKVKSLYNQLRKQPAVDRISTFEASVLAMQIIGENRAVCQSLMESFKHFVDTLMQQNGAKGRFNKTWIGDKST